MSDTQNREDRRTERKRTTEKSDECTRIYRPTAGGKKKKRRQQKEQEKERKRRFFFCDGKAEEIIRMTGESNKTMRETSTSCRREREEETRVKRKHKQIERQKRPEGSDCFFRRGEAWRRREEEERKDERWKDKRERRSKHISVKNTVMAHTVEKHRERRERETSGREDGLSLDWQGRWMSGFLGFGLLSNFFSSFTRPRITLYCLHRYIGHVSLAKSVEKKPILSMFTYLHVDF